MPALSETLQNVYRDKALSAINDLDNAVHNYCDATMCEECKIGRENCVHLMETIKALKVELKGVLGYE